MRVSSSKAWTVRDGCMIALMLGVCAWAFRAPLRDILSVALRDEEQSHVLLAPLVAVWLVWLRRSRFGLVPVRPNFAGCTIVLAGAALSWWGFRTDTYAAWHAGALVAMLGMVVSMTGFQIVRHFAAAFAALAFIIPVPGTIRQMIAIPLQSMATSVTHSCLEFFGFQATRLGNVLMINGEQVAVAEACNGMRLVFSLTLVVYAFVFSTPLRPGARVLLLALSPFVALAANVVRLVPTSLMYGLVSPEQAERFHTISGWLMLPIALLALMGLLRMFKWLEFPVSSYRLAYQ